MNSDVKQQNIIIDQRFKLQHKYVSRELLSLTVFSLTQYVVCRSLTNPRGTKRIS